MARRIEIGGTTKRALVLAIIALCVLGTGAIVLAGRQGDDEVLQTARRIELEGNAAPRPHGDDRGHFREGPHRFGGRPFRGRDHDDDRHEDDSRLEPS